MLVSSVILSVIFSSFAAEESSLAGIPTSIYGNVGLAGGGYGDAYGGKIKEGIYGAGGRVGGNLNLVGSAGLGRKKRQTVIGSDGSAGSIASGPNSLSMAVPATQEYYSKVKQPQQLPLPPFPFPYPVFPVVVMPSNGFIMPPIPNGTHGISTSGNFTFEGLAIMDNTGKITITGTRFVDGNTTSF